MSLRQIIHLPDPRLRIKFEPVTVFNKDLEKLAADMIETMYAAKGIGLAAIQIAETKRLLVIDIGDLSDDEKYLEGDEEEETRLADRRKVKNPQVFVNPKIVRSSGQIEYEEGCLSVPGVYSNVKRHEKLTVSYQDLKGNTFEIETHGLLSIVLQHEMDHLDGIVFTDRLGPMQKMAVLDRYNKLQKELAEEE